MNRIFNLLFIVIIAFSMLALNAQAEELSVAISTIPGRPSSATPAFSGAAGATPANPWVICDQYVTVIHTPSDESGAIGAHWYVRMITDNKTLFGADTAPKILSIGNNYTDITNPSTWAPGPDGKYGTVDDVWGSGPDFIPGTNDDTLRIGPDGIWGTDDDMFGFGLDGIPGTIDDVFNVSYSGLIDAASRKNPDNRASIVWEVYPASQTIDYTALINTLTDTYVNMGYWGYLADMGDSGFVRYQAGVQGYNDSYFRICSGTRYAPPTGPKVALAAFPKAGPTRYVIPDADGKFRLKIFMGAKFGGISAGNYGSMIKFQLYHE